MESSLQGNSTAFVETEDNAVIVETIKECRGLLDKRYDKLLDIWIEILSTGRHQPVDKEGDDAVLKRLTHLKNASRTLLLRYEALRLKDRKDASKRAETSSSEIAQNEDNGQGDSDDEFEDVVEADLAGDDIPEGFINDDPPPKHDNLYDYDEDSSPGPSPSEPEKVETRELTHEGERRFEFLFAF